MPLKIFYMTFGCKVNQYETQNIAEKFAADGHAAVKNIPECDVCIINSCTVTAQSDTKCRHFISRVKRENPNCVIVLCGCYPQAFPDKESQLHECDIICGNKNKSKIPEMVYEFISERKKLLSIEKHKLHDSFEAMSNSFSDDKTRAYLKIQDGCDLYCTYCIIPYARGHIRSKPLAKITDETLSMVNAGHKEIILTGINLCCYGRDFGDGTRLIDAIEAACSLDADYRVRLGSIEPEMLSDKDIQRMSRLEKLCPQFHLSLQSGCDKILKLMGRRYDCGEYRTICGKLRNAFPDCAITTDIMVGFPGETEKDFAETAEFVKEIAFASAHIFPYSRRSGTKADKMQGQIDRHTKSLRADRLAEVCKEMQLEYNRSLVGNVFDVLFEKESASEYHQGHIPQYVVVRVPRKNERSLWREKRKVKITYAETDFCIGEIID